MIQMTRNELIEKLGECNEYFVQWSAGGTWCHCWDDTIHNIEADTPIDHPPALIADLAKYFPGVDVDTLELVYEEGTDHDSDWYGGTEYFDNITISVMQVADALIKKGHLEIVS